MIKKVQQLTKSAGGKPSQLGAGIAPFLVGHFTPKFDFTLHPKFDINNQLLFRFFSQNSNFGLHIHLSVCYTQGFNFETDGTSQIGSSLQFRVIVRGTCVGKQCFDALNMR